MIDFVVAVLQQKVLGPVSMAEIVGDISGILCVWLVAKQHIWNWPIGLINTLFFFALFWWSKLYGDAILQVVFAVLGIYGWWYWARGGKDRHASLPVRRTRRGEWLVLLPLSLISIFMVGQWLARKTDSPFPFWDASVLVFSLGATYLQAKKCLESWWWWIGVDLLSIPLYLARQLYPTAILYAIFLVLCLYGLSSWRKQEIILSEST